MRYLTLPNLIRAVALSLIVILVYALLNPSYQCFTPAHTNNPSALAVPVNVSSCSKPPFKVWHSCTVTNRVNVNCSNQIVPNPLSLPTANISIRTTITFT